MSSARASTDLSTIRSQLQRDGYVLIPAALRYSEVRILRHACDRITRLARAGEWPYVRTLPKQFPPWHAEDYKNGIWGVQHLLHPDLPLTGSLRRWLPESYFIDPIIEPVKHILDCSEDQLVMELYNLLVRPDRDFELRWHRDDIAPSATPDEEQARLAEPAWHAQWNLALHEDRSLVVVPGSHRRPRTDLEREADPYARELPGMHVVKMDPGDLVFYDNNILHRGVYDASVKRLTLHGSIGHVNGGRQRARNVLQHGVGDWVGRCKFGYFSERWGGRAEAMRKRLVDMAGQSEGDVGFSQDD